MFEMVMVFFLQVHKIVDLTEFPDREAMWYLEVMEADKMFYRELIEFQEQTFDAIVSDFQFIYVTELLSYSSVTWMTIFTIASTC